MTSPRDPLPGRPAPGDPVTNWAGNVTFRAERLSRPGTLDELRSLVASASAVRAVGTMHSFNEVADTTGDLVSVRGLPQGMVLDEDRASVTVSAGMRYGELAVDLDAAGLALRNMGSLPHISVAGACSTGTHGSGVRNQNLSASVRGLRLVLADGSLLDLSRQDDDLAGAVVALGCLGVVTQVTLDVVPAYEVAQWVYEDLPRDALDEAFDAIMAGGYSVSLFTSWSGPRVDQVWVKRRTDDGLGAQPPKWHGATLAGSARHPVPGMPPGSCTTQLGEPGPWFARLPHFRLDFTPSSGDELQTEYLLPADRGVAALRSLDDIAKDIARVLQISEIRTVAADDLWLSPSYGRDSVAVHFTWIDDAPAVLPVVREVEARLLPLGARPHWGKVFTASPADLAAQYERLPDFVALARRLDPDGKFRNALTDEWLSRA